MKWKLQAIHHIRKPVPQDRLANQNPAQLPSMSSLKMHALLRFTFFTFCTSMGLVPSGVASENNPDTSDVSQTVTVTKGILDHSRWKTWIQGRPSIIKTSALDGQTRNLLAEQLRLFSQLIDAASDKSSTSTSPAQTSLDAIKKSFKRGAQFKFRGNYYDTPHRDRYDSYHRTLEHAKIDTLPGIIAQLELRRERDLRELQSQTTSSGPVGAQARADYGWINGTVTNTILQLKGIVDKGATTSELERARKEWQTFESTELSLLQRLIESKSVTTIPVATDGSFAIDADNNSSLLIVITVAGRKLYFSPSSPGELRFFNVETITVTRPSSAASP